MGSILDPSCGCNAETGHTNGFHNGETKNAQRQENGFSAGMESSPDCSQNTSFEPIAIIGMAFKFPKGAESSDSFWEMLADNQCAATPFPKDRFNIDAFWHSDSKRQNIVNPREAHFMDSNIGNFDAGFFSMTPQEVGAMDPQQRGLLETTYHAFENAGLPLDNVAGSNTSVHIGCFTSDFAHLMLKDAQQVPKYAAVGTAGSILANRLSWYFDLRGESVYLDTACSSGLIATALACEQLNSGKADMAIAGAANIILNPEFNIALSNMNFLSPSGRCKSFDSKADGYGRGEGFATLILKRVSTAIADGDPIRAVIRSVGTNQDGYTSGGITQPSKDMQATLIRETYRKAGLSLKHTRFFEAHGTGTAVGDPIEARAIGETFLEHRSKKDPIYVGAVKSNIGHLEGTSGLASIVKTVLALERGVIPPNANFEKLNPHIDADFLNLKFPTQCVPWPKGDVRRASINSFGFGGANAHVVVESAEDFLNGRKLTLRRGVPGARAAQTNGSRLLQTHPLDRVHGLPEILERSLIANGISSHDGPTNGFSHDESPSSFWPQLLVLSAADEDGIKRQAAALAHFVQASPQKSDHQFLQNVFHTLNARRTLLNWKSYAVLDSAAAFSSLEDDLSKAVRRPPATSPRKLGLVFTGQGAQWAGMGRELLEWPVFRKSIERSQKFLDIFGCNWNLVDEITKDAEHSRMNDTEFSQTISTAVQVALVDLARRLTLNISAVLGHSSGEIAAAYCAGFLCHESAIKVAYFRGVLASDLSKSSKLNHGMLSVGVSASQIRQELLRIQSERQGTFDAESITVSCINSPSNITLSGPAESLNIILKDLEARGIFARRLKVDLGYHSPQMSAIAQAYSDHLKDLRPGNPNSAARMVSSVTPGLVTQDAVCTASYWVQNMLSPVRFVEAMETCCIYPNEESIIHKLDLSHESQIVTDGWLEVGPHAALKGPLREIFNATNRADSMFYTSFLTRNKSATHTLLEAIGQLHCRNFKADLHALVKLSESALHITPRTITTLPPYLFNHSVTYWEEPARSKTFRSRKHANNDLLGAPVIDWNPLDARWRLIIKQDEMPWIEQHKVHGEMLYPAAGMLAMAIEAIKQLTDQKIIGYEIRDASFPAPIMLNDSSEGTEVQTCLVPTSTNAGEAEYKFRVLVKRADDSWQEACLGTISADTGKGSQEVSIQTEDEYKNQAARDKYDDTIRSCQSFVEPADLYKRISENTGLQYGPMFQPLSNIYYSSGGNGRTQILPYASTSSEAQEPFTVHPSTLDGVFQFTYLGLAKGWSEPMPTLVPSHLTRLWISTAGVGHANLGSEVANSSSSFLSKRTAVGTTTVFSQDDMSIRLEVEALEVTEIGGNQYDSQEEEALQPMCRKLEWKPDFSTMTTTEISEYCAEHRSSSIEPDEWFQDLGLMMLSFAASTFDKLHKLQLRPVESQTQYASWLQSRIDEYLNSAGPDANLHLLDPMKLEKLRQKFLADSKRGNLSARTGDQLFGILTGEVDALNFIFEDEAFVSEYYHELNQTGKAFDMLGAYLDAKAHKDPGLKYLEIGAGTGATSAEVLGTIARPEVGPRYSEYHYTDISPYFISHATEKYAKYPRMKYLVLNIEEEPLNQGFEEEGYDIIIAANVLHATKNLSVTLANTRKLLKPNGQLIMMEMTTPLKVHTGFVFGLLPGWWLSSEEYRRNGAVMPEEQWHAVLKQHGFSGCEHVFRDWDSENCHGWSIIVTSVSTPDAPLPVAKLKCRSLTFVVDMKSPMQTQVGQALQRDVQSAGIVTDLMSLGDLSLCTDIRERDVVLLTGLEKCLLYNIQQPDFEALQKDLTSSKSVIWVNNMGSADDDAPYWAMTDGLARVCRNEDLSISMATLALEQPTCENIEKAVGQIAKVVRKIHEDSPSDTMDLEWMEMQGRLCVNRLSKADIVDDYLFTRTTNPVRMQQFGSGPPVKLEVKTPGLLDTIEWTEDTAAYAPLEPDDIEVRVQAVGVNLKECLTLLGRVNTDQLGSEAAGYVHRIGANVKDFSVGDRVAFGTANTYQTFVRVKAAVHMPDSMSFVEAASIPTAFCTAYVSLIRTARLQKGETILIHAAAGGTGQAAVQLAQNIGAEVFVTVGSKAKKELIMEQYNIPEDHIFYSRDASFADGIKRMTEGRGVDVVLNSLSGKLLIASWESIAPFGRFIEIGRKDIDTRGHLPMYPFIKNALFAGVDLAAYIIGEAAKKGMEQLREVFKMAEDNVVHPPYPLTKYSIDQAEDAFRLLQSGKNSGKMVLEVSDETIVPIREGIDGNYRFRSDATYAVAGAFGGIGRQITRWMARRGAQHLLLLSRSTPEQNTEARQMMSELKALGINAQHAPCDISDLDSLRSAIQTATSTMPPIKGCFQAAMVLNDRPFSTMQYGEWNATIRPKVQGSWNLHTTLPAQMDFFIMLSSVTGVVGNPGQSNYAAGNTFQDALARYRVARGEKAAALDLGIILGEGFVAENKDIYDKLVRLNILDMISQEQLFAMFDYFCDPNTQYASDASGQVVSGLTLPSALLHKGLEVPLALHRSLFRAMHQIDFVKGGSHAVVSSGPDIVTLFQESASLQEAGAVVAEALKIKVCKLVGVDAEERTVEDRMESFGVDSLVGLELRNWISKELRADIAVFEILGDAKLSDVGMTVARKSQLHQPHWNE